MWHTTGCFHESVYCEMVVTIELTNITVTSRNCLFLYVMRAWESYSRSKVGAACSGGVSLTVTTKLSLSCGLTALPGGTLCSLIRIPQSSALQLSLSLLLALLLWIPAVSRVVQYLSLSHLAYFTQYSNLQVNRAVPSGRISLLFLRPNNIPLCVFVLFSVFLSKDS